MIVDILKPMDIYQSIKGLIAEHKQKLGKAKRIQQIMRIRGQNANQKSFDTMDGVNIIKIINRLNKHTATWEGTNSRTSII